MCSSDLQTPRLLWENERLKADVDMWKLRSDNWQKFCQLTHPEMTDEVTRFKAADWQPIQTAPKNYTKILCLWPIKTAYRDSKGYWCRDEMDFWDKHEGEMPDPILWKPLPEGWPNAAKEGKQP